MAGGAVVVVADRGEQCRACPQPPEPIGHVGRRPAGVLHGAPRRDHDVHEGFTDNNHVDALPWVGSLLDCWHLFGPFVGRGRTVKQVH